MSDQAQSLRRLADKTQHDPDRPSHTVVCAPTAVSPDGGLWGGTENAAQRIAQAALSAPPVVPPLVPPLEPQYAVTSARLPGAESKAESSVPSARARVLAVTSGKGGVGKTNFSTNLALTLAQMGQRVIVLDADLGLANLHVVLGVTPRYHLEHVLLGERTLAETLFPGPCGIQIVGGASGLSDLANLDGRDRDYFIESLQELDSLADVVIIDTGAGLSHTVMAFLNAAEEILVVTTPEPTAITDAYATIKVVTAENPDAKLRLIVNMAQSTEEAQAVANRLNRIAQQFLHIGLEYAGFIPLDPNVRAAVRAQKPFSLLYPHSPASRSLARIAEGLGFSAEAKTKAAPTPAKTGGFTGLLGRMQSRLGSLARSSGR